jgi:hypothetical protein
MRFTPVFMWAISRFAFLANCPVSHGLTNS